MELLHAVVGPLATNTYLVGDARTRQAIVIDAAIPCLDWVVARLTERRWTLICLLSTHGHWDHAGENAALQAWSRGAATGARNIHGEPAAPDAAPPAHAAEHGLAVVAPDGRLHRADPSRGAEIAAHPADWYRLVDPKPLFAPFPIPACVPALELAEGGAIRFGDVRLDVLHTPGHTEGSVCLVAHDAGLVFSGDTLFPGGWGRVDLPGGDPAAMVDSLRRLATLPDTIRVLPGHGRETTLARERPWLELVARERRLSL